MAVAKAGWRELGMDFSNSIANEYTESISIGPVISSMDVTSEAGVAKTDAANRRAGRSLKLYIMTSWDSNVDREVARLGVEICIKL